MEHLQQHRGIANAFLHGDASFKDKAIAIQTKLKSDLENFQQVAIDRSSVYENTQTKFVMDSWNSLKGQVFSLTPEESFSRHTLLVSKLVDQIEDVCELASLYEYNTQEKLLIKALSTDLPRLLEFFGQVRGLGTGVAAKSSSTVAEQLKLRFLVDKCHVILSDTITPLSKSSNHSLIALREAFSSCLKKGEDFIKLARKELISTQVVNINPDSYYASATDAIASSYKLFDALLASVRH